MTPLHLAAKCGQDATVVYLVGQGASMDAKDMVSDDEAVPLTKGCDCCMWERQRCWVLMSA